MAKLYELTGAYKTVLEAMFDASDSEGVIPPEMVALLSEAESDIKLKAESCCKMLVELKGKHDAFGIEEDRIAKQRKSLGKQHDWLKDYVKVCLDDAHLNKLEAGTFTLKIMPNPEKVEITDLDAVPTGYDKIPDRAISIEDIKTELKAGRAVPGARLARGTRLYIK